MDKSINSASVVNHLQELPQLPVVDSFTDTQAKEELMYAVIMKGRELLAAGNFEAASAADSYATGLLHELNVQENVDEDMRRKRMSGVYKLLLGKDDPSIKVVRPEPEVIEPVNVTFTDRIKNVFGRAKESLKNLNRQGVISLKTRAIEFFDNDQEGTKRRKILAGAIGVVAIAGAAVVATKGGVHIGIHGNHGNKLAQLPNHTGTTTNSHAVVTQAAGGNLPAAAKPAAEVVKQVHQHLDHAGDDIWNHAHYNLQLQGNLHPSTTQIANETNRILNLNGISPNQAHFLPIGYDFVV